MDAKGIKNNLEYFWMYYKWQLLAGAVIALLIVYFGVSALTQKECALSVMLIDCHAKVSGEEMAEAFLEESELDAGRYEVQVQNELMFADSASGSYAMTSLSRFLADVGSEKLDVCAMLEEDFIKYDHSNTFMDLRECLSEEALARLAGSLVETEDGRIIGVYADSLPEMETCGCYTDGEERGCLGILYNTQRKETAAQYLLFLAGLA